MAAIEIEFLAEIGSAIREVGKLSAGIETEVSKVNKAFSTLGKSLAGALGVFAVGGFFTKAISEASEFEDQVNGVSVAFKQAGISGDFATKSLVEFASQMQETTRFGDGAVLTTASLIQNLARLDSEGLKGATKAALDLSTALRIDLNSAATLVGKAAEGNISAFARYGIQIQKGKDNAETFANTLKTLQDRFGGASEAAAKTFGGSLEQLKNVVADFFKTVGLAITGSDSLAGSLSKVSAIIVRVTASIETMAPAMRGVLAAAAVLFDQVLKNAVGVITSLTLAIIVLNKNALIGMLASIYANIAGMVQLATVYGVATVAAATFRAALIATGIGAVIVAVGALVQVLFNLYEQFGSLKGAIQGATIYLGKFFSTITGDQKAVANYNKQLAALEASAQAAKKPIAELTNTSGDLAAQLEKQQKELEIKAKATLQVNTDEISKDIQKITGELKNAGKTQAQIAKESFNQTNAKIREALAAGVIEQGKYNQLNKQNQEKFNAEILEINKKANDERIKQEQKRAELIKNSSKDVSGFVDNFKELSKTSSTGEMVGAGAIAVTSSITQGAEGARKVVTGALTAGATALLGPFGQALGPIFDAFSQGPEATKKFVKDFTDALPGIINAFSQAGPAFIIALLENLKPLISGLLDTIPIAIDALVDAIPIIVDLLASLLPDLIVMLSEKLGPIIIALELAMPRVAIALATSLVANAPQIAFGFTTAFISQVPTIISSIANGVKDALGKLTGGLGGGGGGGIIGGITGAIGGVGKKLKFAEGGVVPGGAPFTDRIPAMLKPGEVVLNKQQQREVSKEVSGGGGGSQAVTINLMIGEEQLASTLVNLTRQGFRLSGV